MLEKLLSGLGNKFKNQSGSQFVNWLKTPPSHLRMLQSIEYRDTMVAAQRIKNNSQIMLISTEKCMTSLEMVGCPHARSQELQALAQTIAHKYYGDIVEQEYLASGLIKIIMQLLVHQKDPTQALAPLAKFLQPPHTPLMWSQQTIDQIKSQNVSSLIGSTVKQCRDFHSELQSNKIYGITSQDFIRLFSIVRGNVICFTPQKPKHFDLQSILIMCPLIYTMEHSFDPNCYLDGCYLSHDNMSFVEISSTREIEPGEKLTINYGNLSNHDLLMRHGIVVSNNPHNSMPINLDFTSVIETSGELFELKEKLLKQSSIKDIERTTLYVNRINAEMLQYLRVYFLKQSDLDENSQINQFRYGDFGTQINAANEQRVRDFMKSQLQQQLGQYKDVVASNKELRDLAQLCQDEVQILNNNLKFFS